MTSSNKMQSFNGKSSSSTNDINITLSASNGEAVDPRCTRTETIDIDYLAWLIANKDGCTHHIMYSDQSRCDTSILTRAIGLYNFALKNGKKDSKTGYCSVRTHFFKPHADNGRLNASKSLSLQSTFRYIRHAISGRIYRDFDIENCHPVLLEQYCKTRDIKCDQLTFFIRNREKMIKTLVDANPGLTRSDVKTMVLALLNGGTSGYDHLRTKTSRLVKFKGQVSSIIKKISELNPEIQAMVNAKKEEQGTDFNLKGSCMCIVLQDLENKCLSAMERAVCDYTKDPNAMHYCVPIHDGQQVPYAYAQTQEDVDALCRLQEEYVLRDTGYKVHVTEKLMNQHLDVLDSEPSDQDKNWANFTVNSLLMNDALDDIQPAELAQSFENSVKQRGRYTSDNVLKNLTKSSPDKKQTIAVCAPLGSGKSYQIERALKDRPKDVALLMVSFRRTFTDEMMGRFESLDFKDYRETQGGLNASNLLVQVESLHRIDVKSLPKRLIVILDESESITGQFSAPTARSELRKCIATFKLLMGYSETVLVLDGFLGQRTHDMLNAVRPSVPIECHVNTWTPPVKSAPLDTYYSHKEVWRRDVLDYAANARSEPIVVIGNSKKEIDILYAQIAKSDPSLVVRKYTSDPESPTEDLKDVNTAWSSVDIVMYTPTISAGISYDGDRFTRLFAYFTHQSCDYMTCCQMMSRVRSLSTRENRLYVSRTTAMHVDTKARIAKAMRHESHIAGMDVNPNSVMAWEYSLNDKDGAVKKIYNENDTFFKINLSNLEHNAKSKNDFFRQFVALRKSQGAICTANTCIPDESHQEMTRELKVRRDDNTAKECYKVASAPVITDEIAESLRAEKTPGPEAHYALRKHVLRCDYNVVPSAITSEFVETYESRTAKRTWRILKALCQNHEKNTRLKYRIAALCRHLKEELETDDTTESVRIQKHPLKMRIACLLLDTLMGYAYSDRVCLPKNGDVCKRAGFNDRLVRGLQMLAPTKVKSDFLQVLFGFRFPINTVPNTYKERIYRVNTVLSAGLGFTLINIEKGRNRMTKDLQISLNKGFILHDSGLYRPSKCPEEATPYHAYPTYIDSDNAYGNPLIGVHLMEDDDEDVVHM